MRFHAALLSALFIRSASASTTVHCCEDREFQETVSMTKTTESTGTTVGALLLSGGLGIKLRLNVGGRLGVESTDDTTSGTDGAINTLGGLGVTKKAWVGTGLTVNTGSIEAKDTTDATSGTDGAINTLGGLGVTKKAWVGTGLTVNTGGATISAGALVVSDVTDAADATSGAAKVAGGLGVAKKAFIGGNLAVTGSVTGNGPYVSSSDRRLKKNIAKVQSAMAKLQAITGVNFNWRRTQFPSRRFPAKLQVGFIAQEVEAVMPEVVVTDGDGWKSIIYSGLIPYLVEALKEQETTIAKQSERLAALERLLLQ